MIEVHIANIAGAKVKLASLKTIISKLLKSEKRNNCSVNVVLCDDKKILELNRRFRQISKPTDVLSFPFNDSDLLGEIYISVDTAARQAAQLGHSLENEVSRLAVHGAAHLLGFTHDTKREREKMMAVESKFAS